MSSSCHIIRRYTFDIQCNAKARAVALQDSVSSLVMRRLTTDMEQLLQRLLPEDTVAVMDTLELDLGSMLYKDIDTQLPERILEALEKALSGILHTGTPGRQHRLNGPVLVKNGAERLRELLEYYLLTGVMPWWSTTAEREQPELSIHQLYTAAPPQLAALIRRIGQFAYVRKRIIWQFSLPAIREIVGVLEPAEAAFIFEYNREVLRVQQQRQLLQTTTSELEKAVWLFVLTYLLTEAGSNFSRKQFVRSHLTQMARHFNVDYETLLQLFHDALTFYQQDIPPATMAGFIETLYQESAPDTILRTERRQEPRIPFGAGKLVEQIAVLRYYLLSGSFPWWGEQMSATGWYDALLRTAREAAQPLKEMLALVLRQEHAWKRWTALFDAPRRETLIRQLDDDQLLQLNETFVPLPAAANTVTGHPEHRQLSDILLYRLLYGSTPWWGKTYAHYSVNSLFEQLLEQAPAAAVMVFKYAGTVSYAMDRMLTGIAPALFFRAARAAGLTEQVYDTYHRLSAVFEVIQGYIVSIDRRQVLQMQIIKACWQTWAASGYGHFNMPTFIETAVEWWAAATAVAPGGLLLLMRTALPAVIKERDHRHWLEARLQPLLAAWQTEGIAAYQYFISGWVPDAASAPHPLIRFIRNNRTPEMAADKEHAGQTIMAWFRHFLETGALPASAGSFSGQESAGLSARMMEWLYVNYRERLAEVTSILQPLPVTVNALFTLWQLTGNASTPVHALLTSWIERLLDPPEAGAMVAVDGLWQVLPVQQHGQQGLSAKAPGATLPAAVSRLLSRWRQYDAISSATEKLQWLEQAVLVLKHFLKTQQVPAEWHGINTDTINDLLKQAVSLLFREKPALLRELFNDDNSMVEARLRVYDLFTPPAGVLEQHIRQSLEAAAMHDSLLMLQETAARSSREAIAGFREAVLFYKRQNRQERQAFYQQIFRYEALIQHAAIQLDDGSFFAMMEDVEIGWGHPATAALRELQQLFDRVITESGEREKMRALFRQFHIQLLAGHFTLHNAMAYASRFITFLVNTGDSIARRFIGQLAAIDGRTDAASYAHLRNILPSLQQTAVKYTQAHRHMEQVQSNLHENEQRRLYTDGKQELPVIKQPAEKAREAPPPGPVDREYERLKKPEPDTVYVNNAGLVLLFPFLTTAFQRLGWLQGGQFINQDAQVRAIHFLQYTVNGKEAYPEHELALNKVLCNWPLEEPVPAELPLKEEEKQLSQDLLKVVLQQWERMSNSSVEGFQAAFLLREGALWETEEAWFLRVEQRGYDVILQTLPWGLGMARTSWMNKTLYTEWAYK